MTENTPEQQRHAFARIENAFRTNAKTLDFSGLQLRKLPAEIGKLTQLESLKVTGSYYSNDPEFGLEDLPPEIGNLVNLRHLDLSKNNLSAVPAEIGNLVNLEILDLGNERGEDYDDGGDGIAFTIGHNQITKLPASIGSLRKLTTLNLQGNALASLPLEILKLEALRTLDLRYGNYDLHIPYEIVDKTDHPQEILRFYFSVHGVSTPAGQERQPTGRQPAQVVPLKPLNELKLIIVGQGSVGKTSLVQQILHGAFHANEKKTEGIAIHRWDVQIESASEKSAAAYQVNIWDFGGQEVMHATHRFFLTKRSLYILVLDNRLTPEENRVEYWLKIIQSYGGASPVLIVGNKADQHPLDLDRNRLIKNNPNIVGFYETSAAAGTGIAQLKMAIAEQIMVLPHIHDALPGPWFKVKAKLEKLGREQNFLSYEKYLEVCDQYEVSSDASQRALLGFLHDLGVLLYFQEDPRLEVLGILNPQWVVNGVYKIINSPALFQNKGILTLAALNDILHAPEYPGSKRLFIVDMMRKFELCYDIEPEKQFLVPSLLPKDEPDTGDWRGALAFQYHYTVLPASILSRFIVRMNAHIDPGHTLWRSGVVLRWCGNTALVKADSDGLRIDIRVCGDPLTRRDFLAVIRAQFETIHRTLEKIKVTEKVPHPEYPGLIFDFVELQQFARDGISDFPKYVDGKTIKISVQQLLDGVSAPVPKPSDLAEVMQGLRIQAGTVIIGGEHQTHIVHTQGGTYIEGDVHTGGGAFVGRDQISLSTVIEELRQNAAAVADAGARHAIEETIANLEKEAQKGEKADEKKVERWFRFLAEAAPDIWEVAVTTFANPIAGIGTVFQKVAKRAKEEREKNR